MNIAVSATGATLDDELDPRFGRASYLLIVDTDSLDFEVIENPNVAAGGGAGIQSAQLVISKGVKAVLTGNCGPNAYRTLNAADVEIYTNLSGKVKDVVQSFTRGELSPIGNPSVPGHFGVGGSGGPG